MVFGGGLASPHFIYSALLLLSFEYIKCEDVHPAAASAAAAILL